MTAFALVGLGLFASVKGLYLFPEYFPGKSKFSTLPITLWTPLSEAKKASVDPLLLPASLISKVEVKEAAKTINVITMIMIRAMTRAAPDWFLKKVWIFIFNPNFPE